MRKQHIPVAIPCIRCSATGYVENPVYRGDLMRRERLKARKTLTELAARLSLSKGYLSDLELGRRAWNEVLIADYEKALKK